MKYDRINTMTVKIFPTRNNGKLFTSLLRMSNKNNGFQCTIYNIKFKTEYKKIKVEEHLTLTRL